MELNDEQRKWLNQAMEFIEWLTLHPEWIPEDHGLSVASWPRDEDVVATLHRLRFDAGPLRVNDIGGTFPQFSSHIFGPHRVTVYAPSRIVTGEQSVRPMLPEVAELLAVDEAVAS